LHAAVEALRARLQSNLDAQLAAFQTRLGSQHQDALASATRAADDAWTARFAAASAESDQARADERARLEAEHTAALEAARHQAPSTDTVTELAEAMARIGWASSLSATLDALVEAAAPHADQVVAYVAGPGGDDWTIWGPGEDARGDTRDLVLAAGRTAQTETSVDQAHAAIPLIVGDRPVAILHATRAASGAHLDVVQALALHAAACLARLTAVRVTQVMMGTPEQASAPDDGSARRYARLLVSEIKFYNEAAVRTGRERGDLLTRLRPEIDRARRLYEQRVPATRDRASHFHHELVHTLAAGDATRLGA
ncbi:MAG: hypothetical protein ABIX28_19915, partial [Vicinamibacterales bacterium]